MKKVYICIPILVIFFTSICFADYSPVISGNFEVGDRLYTDFMEDNEEIVDEYYYHKYWLKYKKKLSVSDYYYLKYQYYRKKYKFETNYNNIGYNLWGNYTWRINNKVRNKFKVSYKNKDYFDNVIKSYNSLRLQYLLEFNPDDKNDYEISIQRQWNNYFNTDINDNTEDKLCLNWTYEIDGDLEVNTGLQINHQLYSQYSERSNKYGHSFSLGFKYKL